MENQEQENNKAKSLTETPKPSDEVQLDIETVTPDTHKSVPETPVDSKKVREQIEDANDNKESRNNDSTVENEPNIAKPTSEQEKGVNDNNVTKEEANKHHTDDDEGDERDKIETIAP